MLSEPTEVRVHCSTIWSQGICWSLEAYSLGFHQAQMANRRTLMGELGRNKPFDFASGEWLKKCPLNNCQPQSPNSCRFQVRIYTTCVACTFISWKLSLNWSLAGKSKQEISLVGYLINSDIKECLHLMYQKNVISANKLLWMKSQLKETNYRIKPIEIAATEVIRYRI